MADQLSDHPWGWGICASCSQDCDDESDYDEVRRVSTCPRCRTREAMTADVKERSDDVHLTAEHDCRA